MQRLSGLLLMLAGAGLAGYAALPTPRDGAATLAEVTRISAAPDRDAQSAATSSAPAANQITPIAPATSATVTTGTVALNVPQPVPATRPATWSTVVTPDQKSNHLASSKPGDDATRVELTRDLQRELARVGCYGGDVTGTWSPSTQRAMSAFMDRVNASLPTDEPDYILLTLVQGHAGVACGADCAKGEVRGEGGRCIPHAVVAQASRKARKPLPAAKPADEPDQQKVAAAETEVLPWLAEKPAAAPAPVAVAAAEKPRAAPLPGLMSVGGPKVIEPEVPASAAAVTPEPGPAPALAALDSKQNALIEDRGPLPRSVVKKPLRRPAMASKPLAPGKWRTSTKPMVVRRPLPAPPVAVIKAPRPYYAYAGKPRRGDPRPGSMRFNLMQSLGGVY